MNAILLALLFASPVPPPQAGPEWQPVLAPAVVVEAEGAVEAVETPEGEPSPAPESSPEPRPSTPPATLGPAQVKQAR